MEQTNTVRGRPSNFVRLRATLRNFGLKVGVVGRVKFETRIKELVESFPDLVAFVEPLLVVRRVLREQIAILHRRVLAAVRDDEVCRRLMTVPGVGPVVALTYRATVDVSARFRKSKSVGAVFGLTPAINCRCRCRQRSRLCSLSRRCEESRFSLYPDTPFTTQDGKLIAIGSVYFAAPDRATRSEGEAFHLYCNVAADQAYQLLAGVALAAKAAQMSDELYSSFVAI
jgi:Transposase IS116/IS110/IS902 family